MPAPSNQDGNTRYSQSRQAQPLHNRLASNDSSVQSYPASQVSQAPRSSLNGKMLLDGFHGDIVNNFEGAPPKFNPRNPNRTNSSPLLDANDPIQMHLLVSTALEDATGYAIVAPEEVDSLRKQCIRLTQRIESTRQNLAVQSKYRDAAINMGKLYSDGGSDGERRSRAQLGLKRNSHTDQSREAEAERAASERRGEELAQGAVGMTHRTAKKGGRASPGGMPGSPESMYTYSNPGGSVGPGEDIFDERSLYRSFDRLDGDEGDRAVVEAPAGMGADAEAKLRELWEMMHPGAQDGEDEAPVQNFSLLAFSSKVQSLHSQSAMLNDQKEVLQRQIKQQRELNNKSDETKDREMAEMETQLKSTQATLSQVEAQAQSLESKLAEALDQTSRSQGEDTIALHSNIDNLQNELDTLQNQLEDHQNKLEDLQNEHEDLKSSHAIDLAELKSSNAGDLADLKSSKVDDLADLQSQLTSSLEHIAALKQAKSTAEAHIGDLADELEKARKAEAQVVSLTAELEEARDARLAALSTRMSSMRRTWRSPASKPKSPSPAPSSTARTALATSAQQKLASNPAIQKELDALRREPGETIEEYEAEQAERRKLEDELRALKKAQGPGKSSLSQSTLGS
ncbi:hypothetical protein VE04_05895 [Pseudogymnoascus sp. 24MN13]|nr:hypothetical protein VE04_05895 [Pseudogymnoascus sp. 24MN13]